MPAAVLDMLLLVLRISSKISSLSFSDRGCVNMLDFEDPLPQLRWRNPRMLLASHETAEEKNKSHY